MKHMLYAVVAACLAMLVTSGIVAFATAAPTEEAPIVPRALPEPMQFDVDPAVAAHLDAVIAAQLADVKQRLYAVQ
jgi:hypothetical protein